MRLNDLRLPLDHTQDDLRLAILHRIGVAADEMVDFSVFRRSVDARKPSAIALIYSLDVVLKNELSILRRLADDRHVTATPNNEYRFVAQAPHHLDLPRPVIIGTGPCGVLAGLILAQMGFKPILLERGKAVRERTKDTFDFWRRSQLNPESNVQFGEGGAGTFSDGKLYSQIRDPHFRGRKVLTEFVKAGAPPEILYINKPHIGTFRLVKMVENLRETIASLGGEVRFESKVVDIEIEHGRVGAVLLADGRRIACRHLILAIGHSARDSFQMLYDRGVAMTAKPFSIGVRIEHPQSLIDQARYGKNAGHPLLGAADYKLVHHSASGRSAYSFCMCPGGTVVAATSELGRVVTNGMSQYSRNERNANSALVVDVAPGDFPDSPHPALAGIAFQRHWESLAFTAGGGNYAAPAQKVGDFLAGRPSTTLGAVAPSYTPGIKMTDLSLCLPDYVVATLREALPAFGKKIKGFDMSDALLTGVETRTSSPVRIPRNQKYESLNTRGLFPAGEGAGYAGGILSAAVDGIEVAEAVAQDILASSD